MIQFQNKQNNHFLITARKYTNNKSSEGIEKKILDQIINETKGIKVKLGILFLGNDQSSASYVKSKQKIGEKLGIEVIIKHIENPDFNVQQIALEIINKLNNDPSINGIIVQIPHTNDIKKIKEDSQDPNLNFDILKAKVTIEKDVDGLNPKNKELRKTRKETFIPATAMGIMYLINEYNIKLRGKTITVVGAAGDLIGAPIADLLEREDAIVNRTDPNINGFSPEKQTQLCKESDIIILATGIPHLATPEWFKEDKSQIVIDAGFARFNKDNISELHQTNKFSDLQDEIIEKFQKTIIEEEKIVTLGNLHPNCYKYLKAYNPPTGSTGPMTVACLFLNTLKAAKNQKENHNNEQKKLQFY